VSARRGVALLETIVALSILSVSVLATYALWRQLALSLEQAARREAESRSASSALAWAVSLPSDSLAALRSGRMVHGLLLLAVTESNRIAEVRVINPDTRAVVLATRMLTSADRGSRADD
jgi:prepilin-type N-terminal cleavage/methylation domain-containing protein